MLQQLVSFAYVQAVQAAAAAERTFKAVSSPQLPSTQFKAEAWMTADLLQRQFMSEQPAADAAELMQGI